jgi:hypothetical protein
MAMVHLAVRCKCGQHIFVVENFRDTDLRYPRRVFMHGITITKDPGPLTCEKHCRQTNYYTVADVTEVQENDARRGITMKHAHKP